MLYYDLKKTLLNKKSLCLICLLLIFQFVLFVTVQQSSSIYQKDYQTLQENIKGMPLSDAADYLKKMELQSKLNGDRISDQEWKEAVSQYGNDVLSQLGKETYDFSNVEVEPLFKDMVDFDTFSKSDFRAVKVKECEAVPKSKKLLKFVLDDGSGVDRVILSGIHDYYEPEFLVGKTLLAITNLPPRKMMGIDSCGMIISATHLVEGREGLNVLILDDKIPAGAKLY